MDNSYDSAEVFILALIYALACASLLLTGGIMTLAKKQNVSTPPQVWNYPTPYPGYYPPVQAFPPVSPILESAAQPADPSVNAAPPHSGYTHQPYDPKTMPSRNPLKLIYS